MSEAHVRRVLDAAGVTYSAVKTTRMFGDLVSVKLDPGSLAQGKRALHAAGYDMSAGGDHIVCYRRKAERRPKRGQNPRTWFGEHPPS